MLHRVWSAGFAAASLLLLAGCVAQPYDAIAVPQTPVAGPVSLGSGWTLNALGSREQPWCMATMGNPATGVVIVQHTEAGRRAGGHPTLHIALAVGAMGGAVPRGDFLWLALDNDPRPLSLVRTPNPYTALPAAQSAPYALAVQAFDAPRAALALSGATSARLIARRVGEPAPVTLQSYSLPRIAQVVRAIETCSREPTNTRAIQAAGGAARAPSRPASSPVGGAAAGLPAQSNDPATPVWAVPPAAAPAPARAGDPPPAWQAPPAAPAAAPAPAWQAPPAPAASAPARAADPAPAWQAPPVASAAGPAPAWQAPPPAAAPASN